MSEQRDKFSAEVRDVFSGDDLVLMVELGVDDLYKKKRFRLHGVDTPNAVSQGPDTEAGKLRSFVYDFLKRQKLTITVLHKTNSCWVGVVEVHLPSGTTANLNEALRAKGYRFNREKGIQ